MSRYIAYNPEQVWLLPPSVRDELGEEHLAVFLHELMERLDLLHFAEQSSEQGRPGYPPQLLLKVWLYAYAMGATSSRRIEQRIRRWQKQCDRDEREPAGEAAATPQLWQQRLDEIPPADAGATQVGAAARFVQ